MFSFLNKNNKQLDNIINRLKLNMSNNYKDATQEDFKELCETFHSLQESGKLSAKQKESYGEIINSLSVRLEGFTHKDQKPYWYTEKK